MGGFEGVDPRPPEIVSAIKLNAGGQSGFGNGDALLLTFDVPVEGFPEVTGNLFSLNFTYPAIL